MVGRRLILIFNSAGGTSESQKEFLEALSNDSPSAGQQRRRDADRHGKRPPLANKFALGYTYQDILDADHDGMNASLPWTTLN